jgi:hypothetical protein
VVVIALPIGWFRTVLRCEASSGVEILAERFSLDHSGFQIEKFIDFGSYYICSDIDKPKAEGITIKVFGKSTSRTFREEHKKTGV